MSGEVPERGITGEWWYEFIHAPRRIPLLTIAPEGDAQSAVDPAAIT